MNNKQHNYKLSYNKFQEILKNNPDDLFYLVNALLDKVEELSGTVEKLTKRISQLESQLNKNSQNSNKPPSSDGLKKKPIIKSLRKKSNKKSGGQFGHIGKTLKMNPNPDKITPLKICNCSNCGKNMEEVEIKTTEKRQIIDVILTKYTEEFQAEIKDCPYCHTTNTAKFPENVTNNVQYGENLKAIIIYLMVYNFIPVERLSEICRDLFDIPLSQGTIVNTSNKCSSQLLQFEAFVKEELKKSDVLDFDESGIRIAGILHWVHNTSNEKYTLYAPHKKRGKEAMDEINILPEYKGFAIHDYWKSYLDYDCNHGLCNIHHLRELTFIHEELNQDWALKMKKVLLEIKNETDKAKLKKKLIPKKRMIFFENKFKRICHEGFKNNPYKKTKIKKRGRKYKGKALNLLERFKFRMKETLAFMYNINVPFDNNQAERDIRMIKVQQKVSGCFRSIQGAVNFLRIRSFISTVKKHKLNILDSIKKILKNQDLSAILTE